jgi:hypothetical protein
MDIAKRFLWLLLLSFVVVYFHHAFRVFLVLVESIPHLMLGHMESWLGAGNFMEACFLVFALLVSTGIYSGIILGGYWLVNRRLMLHYETLVFVVWFVVLVVMTIGPKALAL